MATGGITFDGSSQYLEFADKVVSAYPLTFVLWLAAPLDGSGDAGAIGHGSTTADAIQRGGFINSSNEKFATDRTAAAGSFSVVRSASPNIGSASYGLLVAVLEATRQTVYYNSSSGTTITSSPAQVFADLNRFNIGVSRRSSGLLNYAKMTACEAHVFNTALTSSDVTTLLTTKPEDVAGWVDGWTLANNSTLTSIGGTRTLTATGSPTTASLTLPYTRVSAPTLTAPTGAATGNTTANAGATTDTGSGTLYAAVSASAPSAAQIKLGQDSTGAATTSGNVAVTSTGAKTVPLTGVATGSRTVWLVHNATAGDSNVVSATWTQPTAPVLSSPTNTPGSTTALIGATTTVSSGTAYFLARVGGSAASAATIIATGQTSTVTTTTPSRTVTGLTASTANNFVDIVQVSGVTTSNVVSTAAFTTTSSGDTTPPTLTGSIVIGTVTSSSIQFSWPAGSDNVGVTSYEVSSNGGSGYVDAGNVLTYTFAGLPPSTSYGLRVRAKDAAGNVSTPALAATQSTAAASGVGSISLNNSALYTFKRNNGAAITSSAVTFWVSDVTTGALIGSAITGLSTNVSGVVTTAVSNASMLAGTTYRLNYEFSSGEYGCVKLPAV